MSGVLPRWLERYLDIDAAGSGEATVGRLDASWSWPSWITLLLVVFAVVWVVSIYARESPAASRPARALCAALRLAFVALVLFMLAEVVLTLERTGLPTAVVMIDTSASMSVTDHYDDTLDASLQKRLSKVQLADASRVNLAKMLLTEKDAALLKRIGYRHRLKVYDVASAAQLQEGDVEQLVARIQTLEADGGTSRLGDGLRAVLRDMRGAPPAAIILLSDGITTEGEPISEVATYARRKGVPIFAVGIGSELGTHDVELSDLLVDEVVFVDDVVNFECTISATGYAGQEVDVSLKQKDSEKPLTAIKVTLAADGKPQKVRIPYRPTQVGEFEYLIQVSELPREAQADNNSAKRMVSVRDEQVRVLLVQAQPSYEFRYLKHLFERDKTIDVRTVLQDADLRYAQQDESALPVVPVRRDDLFRYDVIVLGDVNPALLSTPVLANMQQFVQEKGGGMVLMAGPNHSPLAYRDTPLANLVPVDLSDIRNPGPDELVTEGFTIQPTRLGSEAPSMQLGDTQQQTATIWQGLAPSYFLVEAHRTKPGARVLAEHPSRTGADGRKLPVFIMQYVGAGRVLLHLTDETWRWRFRTGDVHFARYWIQSIRYLARPKLLGKDQTVELVADRREYLRGEPVRLRVRFTDPRQAPAADHAVAVVVEQEGQRNRRVRLRKHLTNPAVFEGVLTDLGTGSYHVWVAAPPVPARAPAVDFLVKSPPGEFRRTELDVAELAQAAEISRGKFYRIGAAGRLARELPEGRQVPMEALPPLALWNRWWILTLCLTLLVAEWLLRKRTGML